ncbi:MAG: phage major tail protein, TP901-1 family [Methylobacteriaceae bacterium]|nr:phage major tail protein, TP901-1 family [Methylobacteriaceae bacterium]
MAAQKGRDLLLKLEDGSGGFATVAGIRSQRIALNAETVDVTSAESVGRWRELLDGSGMRRAAISGSGVFKDAASDALIRQAFFEGAVRAFQVIVPDFGRIEGPFQVTALEYRADHAGEVTFDIAVESAGALSFTAA